MKLGIIYGTDNGILEPGHDWRTGYNQHPNTLALFPKFYPDEIFAYVSPYNVDFNLCSQMDALVYYSGLPDRQFVKFIDKIPCKVIVMLTCGYMTLTRTTMDDLLFTKQILDKADFVLGYDKYFESVVSLFTDTPIIVLKLPMPLDYLEQVNNGTLPDIFDNDGQYDIIIPYGPYECETRGRNGYITALVGQRIIDTVDGFRNMAIFNMIRDNEIASKSDALLKSIGCRDYELIQVLPYGKFVNLMSRCKLALSLDMTSCAGKIAIDCAVLRKPGIFSNMLFYPRELYYDVPFALVDPLDVDGVVERAAILSQWTSIHFERAYQRAMEYSIESSARELERKVLGE